MTGADAVRPETMVLEDVPYLGMDWQTHLDGPQDFTFSSAMRSVMFYLGEPRERDYRYYLAISGQAFQQLWQPETSRAGFDNPWLVASEPGHAVRRMFAAAGYGYEIIGRPELCQAMDVPVGSLTKAVDAAEMRQRVCAGVQAGKPPIIFGAMPGAAVIAGYEAGGDTLVGWHLVFDEDQVQRDLHGYVRMPNWLDSTAVAILIGEKTQPPPIRDTYREALLWALTAARTPTVGEWVGGLEAINAWAAAMERDDELPPGDLDALRPRYEAHDMQALAVAEGRAFGGEILRRVAALEPDAAEDLLQGAACYSLMHDLMWRIWQTPGGGGPGPSDVALAHFADGEVRRELQRIILTVRDLDARAIDHIQRALIEMGVAPDDIPPPLQWEAELLARLREREAAGGADPAMVQRQNVDLWADGVPRLAFAQGKDCTFAGALEAALAPTAYPYSYPQLMGYSGLAFRTRWFSNPERAETPWGNARWHPISPHGEGPEEIAAISRATGWRLRVEEVPQDTQALDRERLITDIVTSITRALPVLVGLNTDMACVYGYHIHSMNLLVRDYQRPDEADLRINAGDAAFHSPFIFLERHEEPLPEREALLEALRIAASNGSREPDGGFRFGLAALDTWQRDLEGFGGYTKQEQATLRTVSWWCVMHLLDARRAAAEFLETQADLLSPDARPALRRAASLYQEEAELLQAFTAGNEDFLTWWGGLNIGAWEDSLRARQVALLGEARGLEEQALQALAEVLAAEGNPGAGA